MATMTRSLLSPAGLTAAISLAALSACQTPPVPEDPRPAAPTPQAEAPATPEPRAKPANSRPAAVPARDSDFLGKPPSALDAALGEPAFVRREGQGEFRRYDTPRCRVYAVITTENGSRPLIRTLSVGSASAAQAAPSLSDCLSGA